MDKNNLATHDSIQQIKNGINVHRKQICKYKEMNDRLQQDIDALRLENTGTNS
jgi:hypothetical protein